jgi:hypothetical protein
MPFKRNINICLGSDDTWVRWTVRRYRDVTSDIDMLHLRFPRAGDSAAELLVPLSFLDRPSEMIRLLVDKAAIWPPAHADRLLILGLIATSLPDQVGTILGHCGWHDGVFQLGTKTIGAPAKRCILRPEFAKKAGQLVHQTGTLEQWQQRVAASAADSSYAAFAIMHALAAPLFRFDPNMPEGAIFHFGAPSGSGKTTALIAGASVAGSLPLSDWSASDRALHERAAVTNGLQLILDDTERLPATSSPLVRLAHIAHTLTSGQSQDYAAPVQSSLPPLTWDCWAISSGPTVIEEQFTQAGVPRSDGDRVRWIDIQVPDRDRGGIWDRIGDDEAQGVNYALRSESLVSAARVFNGVAALEWIRIVQGDLNRYREKVPERVSRFLTRECPNAGDVERRIGRKFALVYAAGYLARAAGILPWEVNFPLSVCSGLFRSVMAARRAQEADIAGLLRRLAEALRILPLVAENATPVFGSSAFAGYRVERNGRPVAYVRRGWLESFCGSSAVTVVNHLTRAGALLPGHGGRKGQQVRIQVQEATRKVRLLAIDCVALT